MILNTKPFSCLVIIMLCEGILFLSHALGMIQINPDALVSWNNLCNSSKHLNLCKEDRLYIFPINHQKRSFNEGRRWCKQLAPCAELGDLISIRNCDQLNDIVHLTNEFINLNNIIEADVQIWTSKLKDLEHEQNLISSCKEQTNFDPQRTIDSNYSILEVETPRIFVRDNDENEKDKSHEKQMGYVLCEIIKPTTDAVCNMIIQPKKFGSKCLIYHDEKSKTTATTRSHSEVTTEIPKFVKKFNWTNIEDMINQNKSLTNILKQLDDKIDLLMDNSSIVNLMNTVHKLSSKINETISSTEFKRDKKVITSRYLNIFSNTLNEKHRSAWTKVDYSKRRNASMEIILQLNDLILKNFCTLDKDEEIDLNPNNGSKIRNQLETNNILLEAFDLKEDNLSREFEFPNSLNFEHSDVFDKNLIFFPDGLDFKKIDLTNSEYSCLTNNRRFASGVVYKNLAEYLHYNKSADKSSKIESDFDVNEEISPNSTDYSVSDASLPNEYENFLVNSELVSFTLNNIMRRSVKLNKPVRVEMKHLNQKHRLDNLKCVFWNFTLKEWSDEGCRLIKNDRFASVCECDHLTNFAILMDISGREQEADSVKSALTMFCVILSIIGLSITIIVFTFIPKLKSKRNLITANLCFNLLIVNILVGFFLEIENALLCRIISIVLFYFLINSFCWMLIQGYFLYQMIVLVFSNVGYFRLKHMILYSNGFSFAWTAIVLLMIGPNGFYNYESSYFCWFSDANNRQKMWFFLGPVLIICILNLIIIILSFKETYKASKRRIKLSNVPKPILKTEAASYLEFGSKSMKSFSKTSNSSSSTTTVDNEISISKIRSWFKGWITLMLLLGLTWILGFLMIFNTYQIASYIFILLNSSQGFLIFLYEIALNIKSRSTIIKLIRDKLVVHYLIITTKDNHMSTKTTTSTTSTINPITSSGLTQINDSGEISTAYVNRIYTLSDYPDNDKPKS